MAGTSPAMTGKMFQIDQNLILIPNRYSGCGAKPVPLDGDGTIDRRGSPSERYGDCDQHATDSNHGETAGPGV
jgi:hypothetical protein